MLRGTRRGGAHNPKPSCQNRHPSNVPSHRICRRSIIAFGSGRSLCHAGRAYILKQTRGTIVKGLRIFGAALAVATLALASTALTPFTQPALAQGAAQDDQFPTSNGNLIIHPVHHAGLVLTWNGKRIVADPT